MLYIDEETNDITLTKGDSLRAEINPLKYKNGDPYVPSPGDTIRFAMKKYFSDKTPLIRKPIDVNDLFLELEPEDTESIRPGMYVYDIELTYADGAVDTFISANFRLTNEVD